MKLKNTSTKSAFSGAEEFLEKYKDSAKDSGVMVIFGLGFYSAFMVASKVKSSPNHTKTNHRNWTLRWYPVHALLVPSR